MGSWVHPALLDLTHISLFMSQNEHPAPNEPENPQNNQD